MYDRRSVIGELFVMLCLLVTGAVHAQKQQGAIEGRIFDESGGMIEGAELTVFGVQVQRTLRTDEAGQFQIRELPPGTYTIRAAAKGFALLERKGINVRAGQTARVDLELSILSPEDEITVVRDLSSGRLTEKNTLVLRERDLDALPGGPGGLIAVLRVMAPFAGPRGPRVLVNGFRGRRLPPKRTIREIRIQENPFSAEYDELGVGRIEILTRPGTQRFEGEAFFSFGDEALNSRNPFSPHEIPFQSRIFSGVVSGPIIWERLSFFANLERHETDDNVLVNATVLDEQLDPTPLNFSNRRPEARNILHTRLDYQLHPDHTLVGAYTGNLNDRESAGVGGFSLPSRSFDRSVREHTLQLTETWIVSPNLLNETRFEFTRHQVNERAQNFDPTILVQGAFVAGGAGLSDSSSLEDRWHLYNSFLWTKGSHILKAGGEIREARIDDISSSNLSGTFTFAGRLAPALDENNEVILDSEGSPVLASITSLEGYRRTLFFQRQGLSAAEIREKGGGPSQFSIAGGREESTVRQFEFGGFIQDDWQLRRGLTLNLGLRYEGQTNINSLDIAPRVGLAWAPDAGSSPAPSTVIRAGGGIFFDRVGDRLTLRARRFDGESFREFIVSDPAILESYPRVPPIEELDSFRVPSNEVRVAGDIRSPYSLQTTISIERQLPLGLLVSSSFSRTRTVNALRSRNINAPLFDEASPGQPVYPFPGRGPVYQYESSGFLKQKQFTLNLVNQLRNRMTWYATYILSSSYGDTEGPDSFPADPFNLDGEYGRSSLDARHSFYLGSWVNAPGQTMFTFLVMARSGLPFDITTGRDSNQDTLFTERPSLATDLTRESVVTTDFGAFDLEPLQGEAVIPRNFAEGPAYCSVNLRVAKRFTFDRWFGGQSDRGSVRDQKMHLLLSVDIDNLFNWVNPASPIGSLDSPFFGISTASAGSFGTGTSSGGNRTVNLGLQLRF